MDSTHIVERPGGAHLLFSLSAICLHALQQRKLRQSASIFGGLVLTALYSFLPKTVNTKIQLVLDLSWKEVVKRKMPFMGFYITHPLCALVF